MKRVTRICVAAAFVLVAASYGLDRWVKTTELPPLTQELSTVVEARDGQLLRAFTVADGRWRLPVEVDEVSRLYLSQLIAFEDKRFYSHPGVDLIAMTRALGQAAWHREVVSGGSTLTMQVARLLEDSGTGRWKGKLRQIRVALALERRMTKDEILSTYLRIAPFGGNIEGVRAASLVYFQKEPARLTEAEAALLVALPQSPERRRPDRHADHAKAARDRVLDRSAGAGVITAEAAAAGKTEAVPSQRQNFPVIAPHLAERLIAENPVPLRHRTTLDRSLQIQAEALVAAHIQGQHEALSAAMVVVDNGTGAIHVSVGAPDYLDTARQGFVDMTRAVRSPGSTLKPLIYGLAFEAGRAHPETIIRDVPLRFGPYAPQNFDNEFRGDVRVREALQLSLNLPAVQLLEAVGPNVLLTRMKRAGAEAQMSGQPGLAIALGGMGLRLRDLVSLYAAFPRGGRAVQLVEMAEDEALQFTTKSVLNRVSAWYVSDILQGIAPPPGAPEGIAYKTGTSYGHRDTWAIGYDGRYTIGVWLGRPDGASMPGELGAELAAPLLFDMFSAIGEPEPLPTPPAQALTVSNSELPKPLRKFRREGDFFRIKKLPEITFPPNGARVLIGADPLVVKVNKGVPPFTYLANGTPVRVRSFDRVTEIEGLSRGKVAISVIDATGASGRVEVTIAQ